MKSYEKGKETILQPIPDTGLGLLRESHSKSSARNYFRHDA